MKRYGRSFWAALMLCSFKRRRGWSRNHHHHHHEFIAENMRLTRVIITRHFPVWVSMSNFVAAGQKVRAYVRRAAGKIGCWRGLSWSLTVIESDTTGSSDIYIAYHFRDEWRFHSKKIQYPLYFTPSLILPSGFYSVVGFKKQNDAPTRRGNVWRLV